MRFIQAVIAIALAAVFGGEAGAMDRKLGASAGSLFEIEPFRGSNPGAASPRFDSNLRFDLNNAGLDGNKRRRVFNALPRAERDDLRAQCAALGPGGVGDDALTAKARAFCEAIRR
jgi:hypothetical protein